MDDYLSKPMSIDSLVKAIEHYSAVKELAASSARTPAVIAVEVLNKGTIQADTRPFIPADSQPGKPKGTNDETTS
jgi:ActR/RegA family two-component response regulator